MSAKSTTKWNSAGQEGFTTTPSSTSLKQQRLTPYGNTPLITPRASTSSLKSATAKQANVRTMFKNQIASNATASSSSSSSFTPRPSLKGKGKATSSTPHTRPQLDLAVAPPPSSDDSSDVEIIDPTVDRKPSVFGRIMGVFRTSTNTVTNPPSSSRKRKANDLGHRVINPNSSQRKRGPTVSLNDSQDPPSQDELFGETQRKRQRRVQEGGQGQLDLVPRADHQGFGGTIEQSQKVKQRRKRELEMRLEQTSSEQDDEVEPADNSNERKSTSRRVKANDSPVLEASARQRSQRSQKVKREEDLAEHDSISPPEPSTEDDDEVLPLRQAHELSFDDSSQSDEEETLQQRLVPRRQARQLSSSNEVLVPDSDGLDEDAEVELVDEDDEYQQLAAKLGHGGKGADDSGYAEMEEEEPCEGDAALLLPSSGQLCQLKDIEDAVVEDSQYPYASLVPVDLPRTTRSQTNDLGPSLSAILMPPPPLPHRRSSSNSLKDSQPKSIASKSEGDSPPLDEEELPDSPLVLVPDTQPSTRLSPAITSPPRRRVLCEETQFTSPAPPRPSTAFATRPSDWTATLESAWAGQRPPTPPPPPEPRQAKISEFFARPAPAPVDNEDEEGGETQVVEDSQPAFISSEQARAFKMAYETTRDMGRRSGNAASKLTQVVEEDIEEPDVAATRTEQGDVGMLEAVAVPTSDAEDEENWSPLGKPRTYRFPTLALKAPAFVDEADEEEERPHFLVEKPSSQAAGLAAPPTSQQSTQWESYWTTEMVREFVPLAEDENDSF